jgi:hypothetical protein
MGILARHGHTMLPRRRLHSSESGTRRLHILRERHYSSQIKTRVLAIELLSFCGLSSFPFNRTWVWVYSYNAIHVGHDDDDEAPYAFFTR